MTQTVGSSIPMKLHRPEPARHVVLTTTKWGKVHESRAELREDEVKTDQWKDMLSVGAPTRRFMDTTDSAWSVIDALPSEPLKLGVIREDLEEIYYCQPSSTPLPPPPKKGFFSSLFSLVRFCRVGFLSSRHGLIL